MPNALPPAAPPLDLDGEHFDRLERASRALGKLDGLSRFLPDVSLFVYWFVRKEAVLIVANRRHAEFPFRFAAL